MIEMPKDGEYVGVKGYEKEKSSYKFYKKN